jgi:putative ABC transport system substrate-binding protein
MKRREFITLVGGAAVAWPLAARAEVERVRRIGILMGIPETDTEAKIWVSAFQKGLQEAGGGSCQPCADSSGEDLWCKVQG